MTKVMRGKYPGMPNIATAMVDVRDVAEAHLRGITKSPPNGRFILSSGNICMR
jgi:nucleoside-diphosphate-sugar epimerase